MGLIVASSVALLLWVLLWALGLAARDAGFIAFSIFLVAAAVRTVGQQIRDQSSATD